MFLAMGSMWAIGESEVVIEDKTANFESRDPGSSVQVQWSGE